MRRYLLPVLLGAALLAFVSVLYAAATLTVQVQSTKLRSEPKFWGATVATLSLGTKVTPAKEQGDWIQATALGKTGWVHKTAVTSRQVTLGGGGSTVATGTSTKEVSMGGKGFNSTVEKEYAETKHMDFGAVDAMSKLTVSDTELEAFLKEGKLAEWGVSQ